MRLVALAERLERVSPLLPITCMAVASLLRLPALAACVPGGGPVAGSVASAALAATWLLCGAPQILEAACIAASGRLDTHVLMAAAALATLAMGLPHEVGRCCCWHC